MSSPKYSILQFSHHLKSDKKLYIIYTNLESLIKKIDECANNPEKSSTTKIVKNVLAEIQCQLHGHSIK